MAEYMKNVESHATPWPNRPRPLRPGRASARSSLKGVMRLDTEFVRSKLDNGIDVYVRPTTKFKTVYARLMVHRDLDDHATATALLPAVLRRGSKRFPTTLEFSRHLDLLYGAGYRADVVKRGERHMMVFDIEVADPSYVKDSENLVKEGLLTLRDSVWDPVTEDGGFKRDYFEQEKRNHKELIEGLINDKRRYAVERCLSEMCKGEPFSIYRYGRTEDLDKMDPRSLYEFYREVFDRNPMDLFIMGDLDPEQALDMAREVFSMDRTNDVKVGPPTSAPVRSLDEVQKVEDRLDVNQGKLVLGFRTNVPYASDELPALIFYNGVLGGFVHSKLFQNVREKASLAYYAYSALERTKGLMWISSGIEFSNYQKALDIIMEQLDQMRKGEISDYEMDCTRKGLASQLKVARDSFGGELDLFIEGLVNGRIWSPEELSEATAKVTKDDIVRVAEKIQLDTIYFLNGREAAGQGGR